MMFPCCHSNCNCEADTPDDFCGISVEIEQWSSERTAPRESLRVAAATSTAIGTPTHRSRSSSWTRLRSSSAHHVYGLPPTNPYGHLLCSPTTNALNSGYWGYKLEG